MKSLMKLVVTATAILGAADGFWRMECHSRTGLARLDPLVNPGEMGTHAHAIHGGSNFGTEATYDDLRASNCTSCLALEDKSAYWTPSMHFIYANGTTVVVPQVGGMLAYYDLFGENLNAFPNGFRMLAGDTNKRNFSGPVPDPPTSFWQASDMTQSSLAEKAIGMNCLDYAKQPPEGSLMRHFLPDKAYIDANCAQGIRAELMFPSCWNGKDLDSSNHKNHMAYPGLIEGGACPKGFPTRVPTLLYETIWDTSAFKNIDGQFVFSNGDPTGYGYHGDFIMGWDSNLLQSAVNDCTNLSGVLGDCKHFTLQTEAEAATCHLAPQGQSGDVLAAASENCAGPADGLCGNVPIQAGPGAATPVQAGNSVLYTPPGTTASAIVPTLSYIPAKSSNTDQYGIGISALASHGAPHSNPTPIIVNPVTSTSTSTPAPTVAPEQLTDGGKIVSTITYTSAGTIYEVAIEEIDVYVTVEPSAAPVRRHNHEHMHRRSREHGLHGRRV